MSVRCFVGDAMVYRALGDVDRALASVDPADGAAVMKTIESFAVECSVNKVWTSEALGFCTDETIQVFGGNGYSREFPAERPYRDARITRIYEGTNEINRLIIPTRLLKRADALFGAAPARTPARGPLSVEYGVLADAKRLAVAALREASGAFGAAARDEQEVMAHIADIVIEAYAVESALARTDKIAATHSSRASEAADCAMVYTSDAADRLAHSAKQVAARLASVGRRGALDEAMRPFPAHGAIDTVAARRRIAEAVLDAGRHQF
jgi:butyryl-CoA dehydrogenase